MTVVCLPSRSALDAVSPLPPGVTGLVWNGKGEPPAGIEDTELLVAGYGLDVDRQRVLAAVPRLRLLQLSSAGVEPWLALLPPGVTICNGRGVHGASTAELAVAGMLAVLRELPAFAKLQAERRWESHCGQGLSARRVLVLGAGDIGTRVAAVVGALDGQVTLVARRARDGVEPMDRLGALLPEHDIVVLALPHTPQTEHLVDAGFLAAMPDGSILVNVARGALVVTDALVTELDRRRISAFLDVTDPEPLPADHPLWGAPNLILTPHVGGGTTGWQDRANELIREQIRRYVAGVPLLNVVEAGY